MTMALQRGSNRQKHRENSQKLKDPAPTSRGHASKPLPHATLCCHTGYFASGPLLVPNSKKRSNATINIGKDVGLALYWSLEVPA